MNDNIIRMAKVIVLAVICTLFVTFTTMHMTKVNKKIADWEESYERISGDVSAFTKVSDPKSIRLYVSELNKILDEIHFLSRMIESGQLADEGLTAILNEQAAMNKKILEMVTVKAHKKTRDDIQDIKDATVGHIDDVYMEMEDIDDKLDRQYKAMLKKINMIEDDIDDIKSMLKTMNKKKFFHTHNK